MAIRKLAKVTDDVVRSQDFEIPFIHLDFLTDETNVTFFERQPHVIDKHAGTYVLDLGDDIEEVKLTPEAAEAILRFQAVRDRMMDYTFYEVWENGGLHRFRAAYDL
jgi:hypothetical protein